MFEHSDKPRIFALPPGVDFAQALVSGLIQRNSGRAPECLARAEVFLNTRRMQRRVRALFDSGPPILLPRLRLVTDLASDVSMADIPPAVPPLRRRLELAQLISKLLDQEPDLAPRSAIFDLADSLASLLDEMQGEGVTADAIQKLDITDQSGHWDRAKRFVDLAQQLFVADAPDAEARQRRVVERLVERWKVAPPDHPVIIAGSTGSRGTTQLLMRAVAQLPQGALVLPGFDFDTPADVWRGMDDALTAEDHPQFRFARLMAALDVTRDDILPWDQTQPPCPARNRLVSLALRPAPVTDQWMVEGAALDDIGEATGAATLIEAPSVRAEAVAIALRLRQAAERGETAALISPDRLLTRQVTAALDRWGIEPDDSAGRPLGLSAPGRFLRHVSSLFRQKLTSDALLALLKHPLANTGGEGRGQHLLWTRELELSLRRHGPPFPGPDDLSAWAAKGGEDGRAEWADWIASLICGRERAGTRSLDAHLAEHLDIAAALSSGPDGTTLGELWEKPAGKEALRIVTELRQEAQHGGEMTAAEYDALFLSVLNQGEVRDPIRPHPNIMIWGTLEARVQGADLVILGGLNDGVWPEPPAPDPWLNREMRKNAGLLLPERRIGLSAHDFQLAIAAKEVWLTRAIRDAEAETVPSRWVNRLTNLLGGLADQGGVQALGDMRNRGEQWLDLAARIDIKSEPISPEKRPSPRPPRDQRPSELPVTQIKTLIRDPFAVYARYVLNLRALNPLQKMPDALMRGIIVHKILDAFIRQNVLSTDALLRTAEQILDEEAPWPAARRIWLAKLVRVADWFIAGEVARQRDAEPFLFEESGRATLSDIGFTLTANADRIDCAPDGTAFIYDYKTGSPPTQPQQKAFDKQLLLEAAMVERGGFEKLGPTPVGGAVYIGLGAKPKEEPAPLDDVAVGKVWEELSELIRAYFSENRGYTARRAVEKQRFEGEYDHLSRYGEWDETMQPDPEDVA
ncbi:double-strand break repair protein AddB [Aliiroseovarius sp. YM-037]|uniref:double-strand break repair protein AddB n=1 Tax=Aliiroseovarius sp. YM-037 TaxID=3341728 RepID=UPI003A80C282